MDLKDPMHQFPASLPEKIDLNNLRKDMESLLDYCPALGRSCASDVAGTGVSFSLFRLARIDTRIHR
jgi:hypothetical protein